MAKFRIGCIEVVTDSLLNMVYRLSIPIKPSHTHLFDNNLVTYVRNGKIRYRYVLESSDKTAILMAMAAVQATIAKQKKEEWAEKEILYLTRLSHGGKD